MEIDKKKKVTIKFVAINKSTWHFAYLRFLIDN